MSLPNFKEIFYELKSKRIERYFQPRSILNGKSFLSLDFENFTTNINNLRQALNFQVENTDSLIPYLENSVLTQASINDQKYKKNEFKTILKIANMLHLKKFYGLQFEYLRFETILQKSIDTGKLKAVSLIIDYILKN